MSGQEVTREEAERNSLLPHSQMDVTPQALARTVVALYDEVAARDHALGLAWASCTARAACIDRLRESWFQREPCDGQWWGEDGRPPEPMTPEEQAVMAR